MRNSRLSIPKNPSLPRRSSVERASRPYKSLAAIALSPELQAKKIAQLGLGARGRAAVVFEQHAQHAPAVSEFRGVETVRRSGIDDKPDVVGLRARQTFAIRGGR